MKVVILGAGQVGETLAENLVQEHNDITLVDIDEKRLNDLELRLDIQTVLGSATQPNVLIKAGTEQADMLIAVTNSDEVNMLSCFIAYQLFRTPKKVARIRSEDYLHYPKLFAEDKLPIDVCISPEELITKHIKYLIMYPGATQVISFGQQDSYQLTLLKCKKNAPIVQKTIAEISELSPKEEFRIVGVFRNQKPIELTKDTQVQADDELLFMCKQNMLMQVLHVYSQHDYLNRRIIIGGGGHIGKKLAQVLEKHYHVKVIEADQYCAEKLATELNHATVLHGDIADREMLLNENIDYTDVFVAITNDDEANIMSCLQAKKLGVRSVMALINRKAYVELIRDSSIDFAISPQLMTIAGILTQIRRGDCISVHPLSSEQSEVLEIIAHGDENTSKIVGRSLSNISLPPYSEILAIIREGKIFLATADTVIQAEDHVILTVLDKQYLKQVEQLFQVNLSYFL